MCGLCVCVSVCVCMCVSACVCVEQVELTVFCSYSPVDSGATDDGDGEESTSEEEETNPFFSSLQNLVSVHHQ